MSRNDPPIWVRAVAAVLLLCASWWLLKTDVLLDVVGESIAAIALAIVAFPVLRGMHLPFAIWPEGPWRPRFGMGGLIGIAAGIGILLLVARLGMTDSLAASVDGGMFALIALGTVFWGFGIAMVRQRTFLRWYGMAALLALTPLLVGVVATRLGIGGGTPDQICIWNAGQGASDSEFPGCGAGIMPAFLFILAVSLPALLVAEELAFRRLLIGTARQTGLAWVLGAAVVAAAWYWLLARSGLIDGSMALLGGVGAIAAGSIYVLSGSLMVSTVFSACLLASAGSIRFAVVPSGPDPNQMPQLPVSLWISSVLIAAALAFVVVRRHGFIGLISVR